MVTATCIAKARDKNNRIIGYRLQDKNGYTIDVKAEVLRKAMNLHQIEVDNLRLTSDRKRILDKVKDSLLRSLKEQCVDIIIALADLLVSYIVANEK